MCIRDSRIYLHIQIYFNTIFANHFFLPPLIPAANDQTALASSFCFYLKATSDSSSSAASFFGFLSGLTVPPYFPGILFFPMYSALIPVSYTHLRAHETGRNLVCRLLLEKKKLVKSLQ
eukprot:TRINITY_DN1531_c0_g1_i14.p2 TRINITY_DN1531_c0_g1~~TRINITY_DN1531_c0_g1_i14.p2  ORF type:complete len:119 (+),score=23.66 TRINITY_DN1531_c0_g1_i14:74-430(+)